METSKTPHHYPAAVSIGKRLKEAREKKSLTIEQVQKQSKIHSSVLTALEEGNASLILTDTYVRSFLKKYCQIVGLSTGEILKEYFPPHTESLISGIPGEENLLTKEASAGPKMLYFTVIGTLAVAVLLMIAFIGSSIVAAFSKNKPNAQIRRVAAAVTKNNKTSKSAKTPQKKKAAAKAVSESKEMIPRSAQLSLVIKVKDPVLVTLTKDGVLQFDTVMSRGIVETVTADKSIELKIVKAKALELTLNGREISIPSKDSVFTLVITRKGVSIKPK